jgi:predicted nuclease of predicted toxin-antitoxin system
MKLLIDNQLPFQLAVFLRWRGHECAHVCDVGLDEASDLEVWTRACNEGWIIVSKDEDFISLASRPGDTGRLIWVRLGNCRNTALIEAFGRVHEDLVAAIESGQRIVEVR